MTEGGFLCIILLAVNSVTPFPTFV